MVSSRSLVGLGGILLVSQSVWLAGWRPASAQEAGYIQVVCEPGVEVLLDGEFKGVTSSDVGGLIIKGISAGRHTLRAVKEGFQPQEAVLTVEAGRVLKHVIEPFRPKVAISEEGEATGGALRQKTGTVVVQSLPIECRIEIPSIGVQAFKSKDRWTAADVPAGAHRVLFRALGRTLEYNMELEAGRTVHLMADFIEGTVRVVGSQPAQASSRSDDSGFVRIESGTFLMGNSPIGGGRDSDDTEHWVRITKEFLLGETEVTQAQWKEVMGTDPSAFRGDNRPVERVSWFDAVAYCNALSEREGLTRAYTINGTTVTWNQDANGYRLPTESEWEYACRAGTTTRYWSGDVEGDLARVGWYGGNSGGETHDVKGRPANAWGLYDMHGNVWEWCWDWKGTYPAGTQADPAVDPIGPTSGGRRVLRGGSWGNLAYYLRCHHQHSNIPTLSNYGVGFRVAMTATP